MGTRTFPEVHAIMMLSAAVRHPWRHRSPPRLQVTANMGCVATARATMGTRTTSSCPLHLCGHIVTGPVCALVL